MVSCCLLFNWHFLTPLWMAHRTHLSSIKECFEEWDNKIFLRLLRFCSIAAIATIEQNLSNLRNILLSQSAKHSLILDRCVKNCQLNSRQLTMLYWTFSDYTYSNWTNNTHCANCDWTMKTEQYQLQSSVQLTDCSHACSIINLLFWLLFKATVLNYQHVQDCSFSIRSCPK